MQENLTSGVKVFGLLACTICSISTGLTESISFLLFISIASSFSLFLTFASFESAASTIGGLEVKDEGLVAELGVLAS